MEIGLPDRNRLIARLKFLSAADATVTEAFVGGKREDKQIALMRYGQPFIIQIIRGNKERKYENVVMASERPLP